MNQIERIKEHPAVAAAVMLTAVYGVVAVIYLHLSAEHDRIQETRITEYQDRLSELTDYRDKYHEESKKRMEVELRNVQLGSDLENSKRVCAELVAAGWEEKFHAEVTSRRAFEEELALATSRYKAELAAVNARRDDLTAENLRFSMQVKGLPETEKAKMTDTLKAFDELLREKERTMSALQNFQRQVEDKSALIAELQDKLKVSRDQNLALRGLVEKTSSPVSPTSVSTKTSVAVLMSSLANIRDDYYCLLALLQGVPAIKGGVSGAEFAEILKNAKITDDYYCMVAVINSARYIKPPVAESDVTAILATISDDYYNSQAAKALVKISTQ